MQEIRFYLRAPLNDAKPSRCIRPFIIAKLLLVGDGAEGDALIGGGVAFKKSGFVVCFGGFAFTKVDAVVSAAGFENGSPC